MRTLWRTDLCRIVTAWTVAAAMTAASAQSFYHAPPTTPRDSSLLPVIRPAFRVTSRPSESASVPPVAPPDAAGQVEPDRLPEVPSHLSANIWKRLPSSDSTTAIAHSRTESSQIALDVPPAPSEPLPVSKRVPDTEHLRSIASRALARGDVAAAERQLSAGLEQSPSDLRLAVSLARVRETRGDWKGAVSAFDTVMRLDSAEARWKIRRAECHYFGGSFEAAVADYAAAEAASAPLSVSEYIRFGDAALRTNRFDVAESAFEAVTRLAKDPLPQVELLRGLVALKQGNTDQARTILLRANGVWPNDPQIIEALRVASATRREVEAQIARVHSNQGPEDTAASATVADVREQPDAPVVSRWRPTRASIIGAIQPAAGEIDESVTGDEIAPVADVEDGWRATPDSSSEETGTLQPDDGAVLAVPGELDQPNPLP